MSDLKVKITPDGRIMIEQADSIDNEKLYELLLPHVTDKEKLKNFLFRFEGSEKISGFCDLCG